MLFNGANTVNETELSDAQPFSYYKMEGKKIHSQERDVSKFWNYGQIRLSLVGLENQIKIDKYMPLRVIGYDGAAYRAQLLEKPKKPCYPIITLVLYFGTKRHWNHNRTLKEVISFPSAISPFVNDYKINVFELAWLTNEQIDLFKSDFREVVMFLKCQRTKEKFPGDNKKLKHGMEILDLLRVMSDNDINLINTIEQLREQSAKGGIGMCDVVQRWVDIGSQQKAVEDATIAVKEFKVSPEIAAQKMNAPLELVLEALKKKAKA